jgi:hypothetical protein
VKLCPAPLRKVARSQVWGRHFVLGATLSWGLGSGVAARADDHHGGSPAVHASPTQPTQPARTAATHAPARAAAKGALPPVGQRKYLLDRDTPFAPVEIQNAGGPAKKTVYLKDPVHLTGTIDLKAPVKRPPVVKAPVAPRRQIAGQMRFKKMAVDGRLKRPRVEFSRDVLPLERADEPVSQEFFQKVFAPAKDEDF